MALTLTLARSYFIEYAEHLSTGLEPYDALIATVNGELQLTQSQSDQAEGSVGDVLAESLVSATPGRSRPAKRLLARTEGAMPDRQGPRAPATRLPL
jgi:hypothetical protein